MNFPARSLLFSAAWSATTALSPAQEAEPATPAPTAALVTIPLPHHDGKPTGLNPAEDGLLREGLNESSHPQAAPVLVIKPSSVPKPQSGRTTTLRQTRVQHPVVHTAKNQPTSTLRPAKPRSPVISFVYWWNGLVIKTFHTKIGTVMLGTIGAKA